MKTIKKDEIYDSLNGFLKSRGIKLSEGSYCGAVKKACGFLTDAVNLAHEGVQKTKVKVDSNLDKLRQTIHDATAPNQENPARPPVAKKAVPKKKVVKKKAAKKTSARKSPPKKVTKKKSPARKKTIRSNVGARAGKRTTRK